MRALSDQLRDKTRFAAFTPQLRRLPAEVQHRQLALGISFTQGAPFTLAALGGFVHGRVEGRVAHGQVKALTRLQQAQQDLLGVGLLAQLDDLAQVIGLHDSLGGGHSDRIDLGTEEIPAIFHIANQRVDAVGAHADVQHLDDRAARNLAVVNAGQQVGEEVHIVGTPRHWRAEVILRDIPMLDAIERFKQCPVKHPHRVRAGEVDALFAIRVDDYEFRQFRRGLDQRREVVTACVAVARVQGSLFARRDGLGRGCGFRLLARWFGCAGGGHVDSGVGSKWWVLSHIPD